MYLHGKGVVKDYQKAFYLFSQSAQQGWADGQLQLGLMHYSESNVFNFRILGCISFKTISFTIYLCLIL